jgi:hypothetical protein
MREGIDHSLFNRWEKRVASHLESYTSLERLITVAGFKDFSPPRPNFLDHQEGVINGWNS